MFPRWLGYSLVMAGAAVAVSGVVMAEEGSQESDSDVDATVDMEQEARLSGPQQARWARERIVKMREIAERVQGMLKQARRDRDIIKITCLNDKMTQINVSNQSFEQRMTLHGEASGPGSEERRDHHYRIMVILAQRVRNLRTEAEGCVGETDVMFGRTTVETEVDPDMTEDATDQPLDVGTFDRPPSASSYY